MRLLAALALIATPALGQDRIPSHCIAMAAAEPSVVPVALEDGLEPDSVLIRYLDHASFAIVTADGTVAVTDYTGYLGARDVVPDVVTMNNAHDTHWTPAPDPRIPHVLKGWPADGRPAEHRLDLGSMLVRNVTTDTRGPFGEGAMRDGNSTCTRSRARNNMRRSGGWTWCWCRSMAATPCGFRTWRGWCVTCGLRW